MSVISTNNTNYTSNYKCSNCGSSNVKYKAKKDAILLISEYPYLCNTCYNKTDKGSKYYKIIKDSYF